MPKKTRNSPDAAPVAAPGRPEIDSFFKKSGKSIIPFTVEEILNEHIAKKLA
jgi:hypothetical protein